MMQREDWAEPGLTIDRTRSGVAFWIHVTPRAKRSQIGGRHGDALRVSVRAPPVEGKANVACASLLARALGEPRGAVEIPAGSRSRRKRVEVRGEPRSLEARLRVLAAGGGLR